MHPLCLEFLTALDLDLPAFIEAAATNGCQSISLLVNPMPKFPDFALIGDTDARRDTIRMCADKGVAVDLTEIFYIDGATDPESFRPGFESSAALGARNATILALDEDEARLADRFGRTFELADEYGLHLVAELSRRLSLKTIPEAIAFFSKLNRVGPHLLIDSLHFFRFGGDIADIRANPDWIGRAQICDGPAEVPVDQQWKEALRHRLIPGEGALPLKDFVAALPEGVTIGIETPDPTLQPIERVRRAVAATRRLIGDARG
jgi:sugar phosphate isomerase/epimerase